MFVFFHCIYTAYDVLSNPEKRKQYDMFGAEGLNSDNGGGPGFDYNTFFNSDHGSDSFHFTFDNMFGDFFNVEEDNDFVYFPAHQG